MKWELLSFIDCSTAFSKQGFAKLFKTEGDEEAIGNFFNGTLEDAEEFFIYKITHLRTCGEHLYWIVNSANEVMGYALAFPPSFPVSRRDVEIGIFIAPAYRSQGLGSEVLKEMESNFYARRLVLMPNETNKKAIALYKKLGYNELDNSRATKQGYICLVKET